MLDQLGQAGECKSPARSSYQAWEKGRRPTPQRVLDAANDLEKNGLFEEPPEEGKTEIDPAVLVLGAEVIVVVIGGLAWLAMRAVKDESASAAASDR